MWCPQYFFVPYLRCSDRQPGRIWFYFFNPDWTSGNDYFKGRSKRSGSHSIRGRDWISVTDITLVNSCISGFKILNPTIDRAMLRLLVATNLRKHLYFENIIFPKINMRSFIVKFKNRMVTWVCHRDQGPFGADTIHLLPEEPIKGVKKELTDWNTTGISHWQKLS